ncbi:molybdopterin-dependent oxidoreductase [uncultured Sphingomonas sp.]|uniref:molybdopterin-dependent oxidoreductase n=1 Tax=uncultured Sphingomonas sp. TaxID=158754 RepID=UPI0035CB362E
MTHKLPLSRSKASLSATFVHGQPLQSPLCVRQVIITGAGSMDALNEADFIVRQREPFNAEPLSDRLIEHYLTPQSLLYVRSHGATPDLGGDHAIEFSGVGLRHAVFTLADLKASFAERRIVSAMQCAGNRRADFQSVRKTNGDPWDVGAIGNVDWTGVSLADVLHELGVGDRRDGHIACTAADVDEVEGETHPYGISITLQRAMAGDVLIAWAIGGEPLSPAHGAPMRLVVPGYAGVRSAKWLTRIELRDEPSDAPIQAKDYKLFPPYEDGRDIDWRTGLVIEAMPVNSAICVPRDGDTVDAGVLTISGYALAYGRRVARVDVSLDGGGHWVRARFVDGDDAPDAWQRWQCEADLAPGRHELVVRAVDGAGQLQPEHPKDVWNFAGYLSTAWHRVTVKAR